MSGGGGGRSHKCSAFPGLEVTFEHRSREGVGIDMAAPGEVGELRETAEVAAGEGELGGRRDAAF